MPLMVAVSITPVNIVPEEFMILQENGLYLLQEDTGRLLHYGQ